MSDPLDAVLCSWPFAPGLVLSLLLTALLYLRGWTVLRRRDPARWSARRMLAFLAGLLLLFLALASPIEPFSSLLLSVHMVQHLLLLMLVPPLVWLGDPLFPLLRGLPQPVRSVWVAPLFRSRRLSAVLTWFTHPARAWLPLFAATWLWHVPRFYELALRSDAWHYVQHACFLGAGLLFWYPVVRPYPARPAWSPWLLIPYLIVADVQNTILSAVFTFVDTVLYPRYAELPALGGITALEDQAAAGVIMWVPGSLVYLGPLFVIGLRLLYGTPRHSVSDASQKRPAEERFCEASLSGGRMALPVVSATGPVDLLHLPLLGRFLRWRHARLALQVPLFLLAGVLVWDGLRGPQVGAMNLAGVLPWVHWRGLLVLGLLAAGNVFCFGCPFLLPRTLARRWLPAKRSWPRALRSKWVAVALLGLFLWAYEAFALWDSPWWTAWLILAYFVGALVIDGFFRGAAFCKYLCPIGQFNFVQSLASPWEIAVRDPARCDECRTKDCIKGRDGIPGCELHLYQPRKAGNMDCTFCLDCVHACPHDNIGWLPRNPGVDLWQDSQRSGVGRFSRRLDLAVLALLLVFGAFVNAAGMVAPVIDWQQSLAACIGVHSPIGITSVFYLLALGVVPALLVAGAVLASQPWGQWRETLTRFGFTLVPVGLGMWLAHYSFHFLTGADTLVPVTQRFLRDTGIASVCEPSWTCNCCAPVAGWLLRLEILFLDVGLLLSLYAAWRVACSQAPAGRALRAFLPWALLIVLLFAVGVWTLFQPMQMRGTLLTG
jgi:cytochrome c oxidase assembly factor CtaG